MIDEHAISDFEFIDDASGEAGALSKSARACGSLNDSMTRLLDSIFGPDEVDAFDASCNTCKHFRRHPMTPQQKADRNLNGMPGHCILKDVPTKGWQRGQFCWFENAECYENRRTGMRSQDACVMIRSTK